MQNDYIRPSRKGSSVAIEVSPGAARTEIAEVDNWRGALHVRVAAQPREGAANEELLRFIAHKLRLHRNSIEIIRGQRSSLKILTIPLPPEEVKALLERD